MTYPNFRKRKLSDPRDFEWYPKTFLMISKSGKELRYIKGPCEICNLEQITEWGHFCRPSKSNYRFRHLKCAQALSNKLRSDAAQTVPAMKLCYNIFYKYRHGAERVNRDFTITLEEFYSLTQKNCYYCNAIPSNRSSHTKGERENSSPRFLYSGIDRKRNELGYVLENCVACCTRCNFIKRNIPWDEWVDFLNRIKQNWDG